MIRTYDVCVAFLQDLNAKDIAFFERDLLSHLQGTYRVLKQWDVPEDLMWAGLFHAIYLTDFFKCNKPTAENRARVRAVIGEDAEHLAYQYCVMNRLEFIQQVPSETLGFVDTYTGEVVLLSADRDRMLAELIWANGVEQLSLDQPPFAARTRVKPLFEASKHRVGPTALAAYEALFSRNQ